MNPGWNPVEDMTAQFPRQQIVRAANGELAFARVRGRGEDVIGVSLAGDGGIVGDGIIATEAERLGLLAAKLRREDQGDCG